MRSSSSWPAIESLLAWLGEGAKKTKTAKDHKGWEPEKKIANFRETMTNMKTPNYLDDFEEECRIALDEATGSVRKAGGAAAAASSSSARPSGSAPSPAVQPKAGRRRRSGTSG